MFLRVKPCPHKPHFRRTLLRQLHFHTSASCSVFVLIRFRPQAVLGLAPVTLSFSCQFQACKYIMPRCYVSVFENLSFFLPVLKGRFDSLWRDCDSHKNHKRGELKDLSQNYHPGWSDFYLPGFLIYWSKFSVWFWCHPLATHFHCIMPTKSWRPIRAKTHRKKVVSIRTSDNILMDLSSVLTMAFNPAKTKQ